MLKKYRCLILLIIICLCNACSFDHTPEASPILDESRNSTYRLVGMMSLVEMQLIKVIGAGWHSSSRMLRDFPNRENSESLAFNPLNTSTPNSHIELDPFENDFIDPTHYQTDVNQWKPEPGTEDEGRRQNKAGTKLIRFNDGTLFTAFPIYSMAFTSTHVRYYFGGEMVSETVFPATRYKHNNVNIWLTGLGTFLGNTPAIDDSA